MMTSQIFFSPLPFPQSSVFCLDLGSIVKTRRQYTISKSGLMQLCDNIWFSILGMKIFAKATAIFVPMAVLWVLGGCSCKIGASFLCIRVEHFS